MMVAIFLSLDYVAIVMDRAKESYFMTTQAFMKESIQLDVILSDVSPASTEGSQSLTAGS